MTKSNKELDKELDKESDRELCEEYLHWADQEGGWTGLVMRNGAESFPAPIKSAALVLEDAMEIMRLAVDYWIEQTGAERL